ncbi:MAG: hypothetical protein K0S38_279 [Candidatus Paceibacter sp.]|jgi:hypothetical protein|nr:hypothetical protein [Candidatus Paceibacter sp.]
MTAISMWTRLRYIIRYLKIHIVHQVSIPKNVNWLHVIVGIFVFLITVWVLRLVYEYILPRM